MIDATSLADGDLEAVQNASAEITSLESALVVPGALENLDGTSGVKVADIVTYFIGGNSISIEHPDQGWTEQRFVPKCDEAVVFSAVSDAVANGSVWLINGPASIWKEKPAKGIVGKTAVIHHRPESIDVNEIVPENLPDAWTHDTASALSIQQSLSAKRGVSALPWELILEVINSALKVRFIETAGGAVKWPCYQHEAGAMEFRLPSMSTKGTGSGPIIIHEPPARPYKAFREAVLDTNGVQNLVDALGACRT